MRFGRLALLVGLLAYVAGVLDVATAAPEGASPEAGASPAAQMPASATPAVVAGNIGRARDLAEDFLRRYPYGDYCQHIETLTGVHPRPPTPGE